jgi:hypothetical protein
VRKPDDPSGERLPDAREQWARTSIGPLPMTPEEEAALLAWRQKVKEFNLEAVRRQMPEGIP